MERYKRINSLIRYLEQYEQEVVQRESSADFEREFALWLLSKRQRPGIDSTNKQDRFLEGNIGRLLVFLSRYLDYYSKRLFKETKIYSVTDFGFLMTLFPDKALTRSRLIRSNLMEKPSGTEVIKRLLREGLVTEELDGKKYKKVRLSQAGREELNRVMGHVTKLGEHVTGDLNEEEKEYLLQLMTRLHYFHKPIFERHDEEEIQKILGLSRVKKSNESK